VSVISVSRGTQKPAAPIGAVMSLHHVAASKFIWLDLIERTVVLTMFGIFAIRLTAAFQLTTNIAIPLILTSEILPVLLIAFRKWSSTHAMSMNPFDWLLAFAGASAPMLVEAASHGSFVPQELCSVLILSGLLIQISAKLVLWRSFGIVAAVRDVKVGGPYRFVRHPMYAGYTIAHIGFLLAFPSFWNFTVYAGALLVQIARLLREEQILLTDASYRQFAQRVHYRLLPGLF
jgi:protein-S-isoprenylcysteine O-methyltransferase Ste14